MDKRFNQSRSLFATDRVPPTIFGIPVVSREEDYTRADLEFFRRHPEAGGYYDTGDAEETDGAVDAGPSDATAVTSGTGAFDEAAYQAWRATLPKELQYEGDYDLRGYYADPTTRKDAVTGDHFIDRYKLPNHPTFSVESKYATGTDRFLAGSWKGEEYVAPAMKDFSLAFEEALSAHAKKGTGGKTYYEPHKRSANDWDVGGYHYYLPTVGGDLVKIPDSRLISKETYGRSVKAVDESHGKVYGNVLKHHKVDPSKLDRGIATAFYDLVFQGGGESVGREKDTVVKRKDGTAVKRKDGTAVVLRGSPLFHKQMKTLTGNGVPAEDAFGIAMLLEHDSYGGMNYRRFAARGKMIADALSRSRNAFAKRVAREYLGTWKATPKQYGGGKNQDAFGTDWTRHAAAMRKVSDMMTDIGIAHSGRSKK